MRPGKECSKGMIPWPSGEIWKICVWVMTRVEWLYQQNLRSYVSNVHLSKTSRKGEVKHRHVAR